MSRFWITGYDSSKKHKIGGGWIGYRSPEIRSQVLNGFDPDHDTERLGKLRVGFWTLF